MGRTHKDVGYSPKSEYKLNASPRKCSPEFLAEAFAVLAGRWKLSILHSLFGPEGELPPARRFSELERAIPHISQKMLIQQLRCLERDGIVERTIYPQVPPKVEYRLTALGVALRPALRALVSWANGRDQTPPGHADEFAILSALL